MKKYATVNGKIIVGLTENIELRSNNGNKKQVMAKVDTGATRSSIDIKLASKLNLGPVIKSKMVKSASGTRLRPIIEAEIIIAGKKIRSEFTLADRTHMMYEVLIGVNVLKHEFLVDPSKK
ncbi:MAG: ATP-dependent zinc protease [Nanoarchaeota archaeon]|nr:ATP-dependent zinc protease [Nanoarchaeota archaeon]